MRFFRTLIVVILAALVAGCAGPDLQSTQESAPDAPTRITAVDASKQEGGARLTIKGDSPLSFSVFRMSAPSRLIMDIADADVSGLDSELDIFLGGVTVVRPVQFNEESYRIGRLEICIDESSSFRAESSGNDIVVDFFKQEPDAVKSPVENGPEIPIPVEPVREENAAVEPVPEKSTVLDAIDVEPGGRTGSGSGEIRKEPASPVEQAETELVSEQTELVSEQVGDPGAKPPEKSVPGAKQDTDEAPVSGIAPSAAGNITRTMSAEALPVTAFRPGEQLTFVLKWAGIPAGDSVMSVSSYRSGSGAKLYKVVSTARSRSVVDIFYKVRNRVETYIDPASGLTEKYVVNSREGGKRKERVLIFDQGRNLVTRLVREKGNTSSMVFQTPSMVHDSLSSFYAIRDQDLKIGESLSFKVFEGKKNWELVVDVLAKEEITVRAGTFKTIKIHPLLKYEGIFRRKGELFVWVTDDDRKMPVLMKSKVKVGSIAAELAAYGSLDEEDGSDVPGGL